MAVELRDVLPAATTIARCRLVDGAERTMLTILRRRLLDYCRQSIEQKSPPGAQGRGRQHRIAQAELHGSDETADQPTRAPVQASHKFSSGDIL